MAHTQNRSTRINFLLIGLTVTALLIAGVFVSFAPNELRADSHEKVKGIDVSQWQGKVRWDIVKQNGISFGYAKATGGITYTDPEFVHNWHGMREAGLPRGAYHFFYAHDDPQKQAENFIEALQKSTVKPDDLPPVLDLEITDKMSKTQIAERAFVWLQAVEQALGKKPILYTDPGFANTYLTDPKFADYRLWVADYGVEKPTHPQAWKGKAWTFWQHTQTGEVAGVNGHVDLDVFNGTKKEFMALMQSAKTQ